MSSIGQVPKSWKEKDIGKPGRSEIKESIWIRKEPNCMNRDGGAYRLPIGMCGKPKFGSNSVVKNRTVQKFDIRSDSFPIYLKCMQSAIEIKS